MVLVQPDILIYAPWLWALFLVLGHISSDHGNKLAKTHASTISWGYVSFLIVFGVFLLLNFLGIFGTVFGIDTALLLTIVGGYRIFSHAVGGLMKGKISLDFIVFVAAISALALGEFIAAAEVIYIMLIGEGLEDYTVRKARNALRGLVELAPRTATVRRDGADVEIPIAEVNEGDTVIVRPGENIPIDGIVLAGQSSVNQATITGESISVGKGPEDEVYTGTLNELGLLEIRVTAVGPDTVLSKIIHLVEEAQERKAPIQRSADRFAKYFLPAIVTIALGTWFFTGDVIRAVSVLIIACPCAMVLATPAAVVAGIGRLARDGILGKGGEFLEAIGKADSVVFDKTGTLTKGEPVIAGIYPFGGRSDEELLATAAMAEQHSTHILADLIVNTARERNLDVPINDDFTLTPGMGVEIQRDGRRILVGSRRLLENRAVVISPEISDRLDKLDQKGQTLILVAQDAEPAGAIAVEDTLRDHIPETIADLEQLEIGRLALLTGDNERVARRIARLAGLSEYHADLLPDGKVEHLKAMQNEGRRVIMLGDGINDAPALATADVGIAMGRIGTDITAEAADIVFMNDDIHLLPDAVRMGRRTLHIIHQNLWYFAVFLNLAGIVVASLGYLSPVMAAVVHQVGSLMVILNSLRLLSRRKMIDTALGSLLHRLGHKWSHLRHDMSHWKPADAVKWAVANRQNLQKAVPILLALFLFNSSLYLVSNGQQAVVQRFGRMTADNVGPGLHLTWPWPIGSVTLVHQDRIRRCEVGFRTTPADSSAVPLEPAAYEWNIQHREGRFQKLPDEALVLTGDENLLECNLVVQYIIEDAAAWLFGVTEPESLVRGIAETAARVVFGQHALDYITTTGRHDLEAKITARFNETMHAMGSGIIALSVNLQDVHPPLEVVDAFRDVSSALEEKEQMINGAEGYRNEQLPLARGTAAQRLIEAAAYTLTKTNRAQGDADKFIATAEAYKNSSAVTRTRLYLETVETVLAGVNKHILDESGRANSGRHIYFLDKNIMKTLGQGPTAPVQYFPAPPQE